jgi:ribosomal protein S18 acetylase RimI-like enzyme
MNSIPHAEVETTTASVTVEHATNDAGVREVRALFVEYAQSLSFSLDFQGFAEELDTLPASYAPPTGRLMLAFVNGDPVGCVALRQLEDGICEMKRLYVRPEFRGQRFGGRSIGVTLVIELLKEAQRMGYKKMRLDTVSSMKRANALYKALGFRQIEPYCFNPFDDAIFMELDLVSE